MQVMAGEDTDGINLWVLENFSFAGCSIFKTKLIGGILSMKTGTRGNCHQLYGWNFFQSRQHDRIGEVSRSQHTQTNHIYAGYWQWYLFNRLIGRLEYNPARARFRIGQENSRERLIRMSG